MTSLEKPQKPTKSILSPEINDNSEKPLDLEDKELQEFLDKNPIDTTDFILPRSSTITQKQAEAIISTFAKNQDIPIPQAKVAMTLLFQSGGTAKSCDGNLTIQCFGKPIKLSYLRKALTDAKCKGCERKLARYYANEIFTIAKTYKVPGNLFKRISRDTPQRKFSEIEAAWLSDFQVENETCPTDIRFHISETFKKRGEPNNNPPNKEPNNRKKKTGK
jgi:hypothetical protein